MALRPRRNAGLTVRWMLKRWKNAREMHGTRPQLVDVLDDATRKRGLVITFVREPVSRFISTMRFVRRLDERFRGARLAGVVARPTAAAVPGR